MTNNTKKRFKRTKCNTAKSPTTSTEPSNLLEDKIEDLINSVSFMSQQFDEFNKKIESILNEVKLYRKRINYLRTILSKEISEIRQQIDILEQQNLGTSIEIIGIPKTENENCLMNIDILVIEAKRITAVKSKSNLIVAKLESKENRSQQVRNSKNAKLKANMLVNNWSTENKIFINEHLTKDKRILFVKTRAAAKDKKYKFTWIFNAEILTRKDENSKTMQIKTFSDLEKNVSH